MDINNQNNNSAAQQSGKSYWKHVLMFFLILIVVGGGFWTWNRYFSEGAKYGRQVEENMKKYTEWEKNYNKAMTEDVYGGKTPQETLNMFIDALKKEDVELASKYFLLNEIGQIDQKWVDGLKKIKEEGRLQEIVNLLSIAKADPKAAISEEYYVFSVHDENGKVVADIDLYLNKMSGIWKIENI